MISPSRRGGFTLVEVLVALVITALCASVFVGQITRSTSQYRALENTTFATWIAQNVAAEYRLGIKQSLTNSNAETVEFGGRDWLVTAESQAVADTRLSRVEIKVSDDSPNANSIVTLVTYVPVAAQ